MARPARWISRWLRSVARRLFGSSWKGAAWRVLALVVAIGAGGLLFVSAGLMPVAATDGHWPITRMFLDFTMRRSVATHTLGLDAPPLDDPAMVAKGAGHYATGCMPCHGAPGTPRSPLVLRMLPPPPDLPGERSDLDPEAMFWVIKHGLKYTAMPGWPARGRDDEVWAMVAFMQRLPDLDEAGFQQLAYGGLAGRISEAEGAADFSQIGVLTPELPVLATCIRCHGEDGAAGGHGAFPRLAGLSEEYLRASLDAYAQGRRHSGVMQLAVAGLDDRALDDLARHFAAQQPADAVAPALPAPSAGAVARGGRLAAHGDPARRIAACVACHGADDASPNPAYPALAGQHRAYLALQLQLFQRGQRGGTAHAPIMRDIAKPLTARDIEDLAAYYASLR